MCAHERARVQLVVRVGVRVYSALAAHRRRDCEAAYLHASVCVCVRSYAGRADVCLHISVCLRLCSMRDFAYACLRICNYVRLRLCDALCVSVCVLGAYLNANNRSLHRC